MLSVPQRRSRVDGHRAYCGGWKIRNKFKRGKGERGKRGAALVWHISLFEFSICFGFRISGFGFGRGNARGVPRSRGVRFRSRSRRREEADFLRTIAQTSASLRLR